VPADLQGIAYDGLMVASPANPTGTMLDRDAMAALIDACQAKGATFLSDEIYHGIEYERRAVSALEISDDVCVINSFSKYFSMTGWRVGWMVVPPAQVRQVERLAQNMFICAPHAAQVAALAAMDADAELQTNMTVYTENRRLMLEGLPQAGFDRIAPPDGAFYVYADVSHLTDDSRAFAQDILEKVGVAVTPGLDFDPVRGAGTLRFSYARSTEDIREGLTRLAAYMGAR
jgi:aspartate/methionine/tyrosine aminotransferase